MNRVFEKTSINVPNSRPQAAYRIRCAKCGNTEKVTVTTARGGVIAPEGIASKFRNKGWAISSRGHNDICPECQTKRPKVEKTESNVVELVRAEAPRAMGKEDRRVIFAKINDVYLDEQSGYSKGWTDQKVADDLGVPVAWVAEIRERDFGKELNETERLIEDAVAEANRLADRMANLLLQIRSACESSQSAMKTLESSARSVEAASVEFASLLKKVDELVK